MIAIVTSIIYVVATIIFNIREMKKCRMRDKEMNEAWAQLLKEMQESNEAVRKLEKRIFAERVIQKALINSSKEQ